MRRIAFPFTTLVLALCIAASGFGQQTAAGGRTITSGPNAGIGHDNPNKSPTVHGFKLTDSEKQALIAFLESLTDSDFLHNAKFSDPRKR